MAGAISLIRWLETRTVRPCAARDLVNPRIHRMPSGSSPAIIRIVVVGGVGDLPELYLERIRKHMTIFKLVQC